MTGATCSANARGISHGIGHGIAQGLEGFAARYPRVWHVIEAEGAGCETLYPTETLRSLAGLKANCANRDDFQRLVLPDGNATVLRAQLMWDARLRPTLAGAFSGRPDLWRDHIDRHVFFWVTAERRDRFVTACIRLRTKGSTCNGLAPVVIEIETESLLAAHHAAAFFSMINTGSVIRGGARTRRDETTLRPIAGWRGERVVELAIRDPVPLTSSANIAG